MAAHGGSLLGGCTLRAECIPRNSPPTPGGNPVGNGNPDVDDWEVTFLRGGGWDPLEQPFQPPAPEQLDGGWEPRGQTSCPQHLFNPVMM